jgi:hypothetical protein
MKEIENAKKTFDDYTKKLENATKTLETKEKTVGDL